MRIRTWLPIAAAVIVTLSGMVAYGWIRARWDFGQIVERGDALQDMPEQFGGWERKASKEIDENVLEQLECEPHHCFDYVYYNRDLNASVEVAVFFGPAGPVAVHTPDICYRNSDFKIVDSRGVSVGEDQFQLLEMRRKSLEKTRMHVVYAWRYADRWEVSDSPRFAYAFKRYLFKLQLAAAVPPTPESQDESDEDDDTAAKSIAVTFLESFLPAFEEHVAKK